MSQESYSLKTKLFKLIKNIPEQKVVYFGQLAKILNTSARTVGWILSGMKKEEWEIIPWYRVVAKDGYISSLKLGQKGEIQRQILLDEDYEIIGSKVNMKKHLAKDEEIKL